MTKKIAILAVLLYIAAGSVFGQHEDIFTMLEGLTHNFPVTEDGARRIMINNGFILAGKDRYINSLEGISIESWSEDEYSTNGINITFIFNFNNDTYFIKFIRDFLTYFSNKYDVSKNGSDSKINFYVFYNENDPATLSMVYNAPNQDVVIWVSLNN